MIAKYRNRGLIQLGVALVATGLLVYLATKLDRRHRSDNLFILILFVYIGCWVLWMAGSLSLAKAKGYGGDMAGGILLFLILLGFCVPISVFAFPVVVMFGLKDKTGHRSRRY